MRFSRIIPLACVISTCCLMLSGPQASAQEKFPARQIELIVPYGAGGGTDSIARIVGQHVSQVLTVPVVIVNKAGAAGAIGTSHMLTYGDGYHIATGGNSNLGPLIAIGSKPPYTLEQFAPIARAVVNPLLIVAKKGRFADFNALVKEARDKPDTITYGSWGYKSPAHLYGELFVQVLGTKLRHIPFDGGTNAMLSALAGHTDIAIVTVATARAQLQKGDLVALAITSGERESDLPNIPTIGELGFKGATYVTFEGFVASARTPEDQLLKLRGAFAKVLNDPQVKDAFRKMGSQPGYLDGPEYAEFMRQNIELQRRVAKSANINE